MKIRIEPVWHNNRLTPPLHSHTQITHPDQANYQTKQKIIIAPNTVR